MGEQEGQFFSFQSVCVLPRVLENCKRGTLASFPVFNEKTEIFLA